MNKVLKYKHLIDWPFLIFLIGITSVKLQVKIIILTLYLAFLLIRKIRLANLKSNPTKFYLLMPVIGSLSAALVGSFQFKEYWLGNIIGVVIWLMCALSFVLLSTAVNTIDKNKIENSILTFFVINWMICIIQIAKMIIASRHIFPYWYTELSSIYGVSSGDHLHGIFQDNSTVNAAISMISVFYFLLLKKYKFAFISILVCLLCTSNLTVFILLFLLVVAFFIIRLQRVKILLLGTMCFVMYMVISPENLLYVKRVIDKVNKEENSSTPVTNDAVTKKIDQKTDSVISPPPPIHEAPIVHYSLSQIATQPCVYHQGQFPMHNILQDFTVPIEANLGSNSIYLKDRIPEDTNALRDVMGKWYGVPYNLLPLNIEPHSGKILYLQQTLSLLKSGYQPCLVGVGIGNFSSKMAIKMTGFKLQGQYPERYRYISRQYFENAFYVHMYFWAKSIPTRSIINYPGSVYCQIGGEYGMIGFAAFMLLYIGYFVKRAWATDKRKLVLILALLLMFFFDYWFEMLTLTIFFELFMLLDLKPNAKKSLT